MAISYQRSFRAFSLIIVLGVSGLISAGHYSEELGLPAGLFPRGKRNNIGDVSGVKVGHVTLNSGTGKLVPGKGPIRTGITVVIPGEGDLWTHHVQAGTYILNGNGEFTGLAWLQESGALDGPIALTNTLSVSAAHRGLVDWTLARHPEVDTLLLDSPVL